MKKIVVTGASGFIGKNLIKELRKLDVEIVAVSRNINSISEIDRSVNSVEMDISNPSQEFLDEVKSSDVLIHLAWNGLSEYKSMEHINTELPTHFNFLKLVVESGIKNICVTGTCFEYGIQSGELSENMETRPVTPYGYAKDALRKQLQFLQNEISFNLTWLRPFYVYGEDQPDNTLYSQLRISAEQGESLFNMSGGEQLRDYLHVSDLVHKIIDLACLQKDLGIVNVCSGFPITVKRLVEQWIKEKSWNIQPNTGYYEYPSHEPMAFWGDVTKFNKVMNLNNV